MAFPAYTGLERWQRMQSQPIGSLTNMGPPNPAASAYKRMASDYGQALRTLRRAGRRGDEEASMRAIDLQNAAIGQGVQGIQGIRRAEDQRLAEQGFAQRLSTLGGIQERANQEMQQTLGGGPQTPRLSAGPQTPRLNAGPQTPRLDSRGGSYNEQELNQLFLPEGAQAPATTAQPDTPAPAALDPLARNRSLIAQRGFLDRVRQGLDARGGVVTEAERGNLEANAERMGLDAERFRGFLDENAKGATTEPPAPEQPWALAEETRGKVKGYLEANAAQKNRISALRENIEKQRGELRSMGSPGANPDYRSLNKLAETDPGEVMRRLGSDSSAKDYNLTQEGRFDLYNKARQKFLRDRYQNNR